MATISWKLRSAGQMPKNTARGPTKGFHARPGDTENVASSDVKTRRRIVFTHRQIDGLRPSSAAENNE